MLYSKTIRFKTYTNSNESSKILPNLSEMIRNSTVSEKAVGFSPLLIWLSFPHRWRNTLEEQPTCPGVSDGWGLLLWRLQELRALYYFLVTSINFFLRVLPSSMSLSPNPMYCTSLHFCARHNKMQCIIYTTVCPTRLWAPQWPRTCPFLKYIHST